MAAPRTQAAIARSQRRRRVVLGALLLVVVGAIAWMLLNRPRAVGREDDVGRVFVVFDQPDAKAAEFLDHSGLAVEHGTMNDWLRRLADAGDNVDAKPEGEQLLAVITFADQRGVGHIVLETPTTDELAALGDGRDIPPAPDGARWLALPIGDLARRAGAAGSWSDSDRPWMKNAGVGALEALMRQHEFSEAALVDPKRLSKERLELADMLEYAHGRLETVQNMAKKRDQFAKELFGPAIGPDAPIITAAMRSGDAVPISAERWVSLTRPLELVCRNGRSLELDAGSALELTVDGFDGESAPVLDERGAPVRVAGDANLVASRDGRAFFVRTGAGAQRAYRIETNDGKPSIRQLGRFEAPRKDERHSRALSGRGQLVRVVDTGQASWLRVYDGNDQSVDLTPIPNEHFGRVRWVDDDQLVVAGRTQQGRRPDVLWLFDLRKPNETKALKSKLGQTPRGTPRNAGPSRIGEFIVTDDDQIYAVERHVTRSEIVRAQLKRNATGVVTGISAVGPRWEREDLYDFMGSADGRTLCWRGREPSTEYIDCATIHGDELLDGVRLPIPTVAKPLRRTERRRHRSLSRDGRLLIGPVHRDHRLLDDPVALAFGWRVSPAAAPDEP